MIDPGFAQAFGQAWIEAWNAHDLDRIFSHYAGDFEMTSPFIVQRMHAPSGRLKGKAAIRPDWQRCVSAVPPPHFELEAVLVGVNRICIVYRRASGRLSAEVLLRTDHPQVIKGIAHYQ